MFERFRSERDASQLVLILRRRWPLILAVAIIAAGAAYELTKRQPRKYSASASVWFTNSQYLQILGIVASPESDPNRAAATNASMFQLATIGQLAAQKLGVPRSRVSTDVTFTVPAESDVATVNVTDPVPHFAAALANTYVQEYIAYRKSLDRAQLESGLAQAGHLLATIPNALQGSVVADNLRTKVQELQLAADNPTGNATQVLTATIPTSPSSPKPTPNAILGLVIGLVLGTLLAFMIERRDRRIKTAEEAAALYDLPVIGEIPARGRAVAGIAGAGVQESFHMLRAQLRYFNVDREVKRVLVTSAEGGEGKSFVALNLATAAGRTDGKRALLIEADLRHPSMGDMLGFTGMAGLAELLSQSHDLTLGLRELVVPLDGVDGSAPRCDLLLAGASPPNPVELLESKGMAELLRFAASVYDMVIIDSTPIGTYSDAISLVHQVDGVVLVTRLGHSGRDRARHLMALLRGLGGHILGLVINGSEGGTGYYRPTPYDRESALEGQPERTPTRR